MKKLSMLLVMSVFISINSFAQDLFKNDPPKVNLHLNTLKSNGVKKSSRLNIEPTVGLGMMAGGAILIIAGATTSPITMENKHNEIINKPFHQQGAKALAIVTGGVVLGAGIIISLGSL